LPDPAPEKVQRRDVVEFVRFDSACDELKHFGVAPVADKASDGSVLRFTMRTVPKVTPRVLSVIVHTEDAADDVPAEDGAAIVKTTRDRLPEIAEGALHIMHLDEVMLIPSGTWGDIINLVAFDLATDESWLSIDAEASLHQTRRDPLVLGAAEMGLVATMGASLLKNGEGDKTDLTIAATGAPLMLELSCKGVLRVWCAHEEVRDHLTEIV
jgi:hypothetical protein